MPGAALLFRPGPTLGAEARRIALAVLEDAAQRRGGRVVPLRDGALRLEGPPPALDGARDLLSAVLHGRDAALSEEAAIPVAGRPPGDAGEDRMEDRLDALPLASLLRRDAVRTVAPDGSRPLATRIMPDDAALLAALRPDRENGAREDGGREREPWLSHARDHTAARCLRDLPPGPLHLLVPEGPVPSLPPGILPLLGPRALARPPTQPFGVIGLAPEAFALLGALPATAVAIYLAPPVPEAAWAAVGPGRIILDGPADLTDSARRGALGFVRG